MHIGKTMRRLRLEAGIQQKEMARQMGVSQNALGSIEKESWVPKMGTVEKFCEAILFEWKDTADLARKTLTQIKAREEEQ